MTRGGRRRGPSFLEQLLRRIAPPRYPEYEEYRGEPPEIETSETERPVVPPSAGPSVGASDDDEAGKIRRLRILSFFIIILSFAGFIYFYLTNDASVARRARPQELLAIEAARELAPQDELRNQESLADIKRWSAEVEERVAREMDQGETPVRAPIAPGEPAVIRPPAAPWFLPPELLSPPAIETPAVRFTEPVDLQPEAKPPGAALPAPGGIRRTPVSSAPATAVETPAARRASPYRRRELAPIVIEPRTLEPY